MIWANVTFRIGKSFAVINYCWKLSTQSKDKAINVLVYPVHEKPGSMSNLVKCSILGSWYHNHNHNHN